MFPAESVDKPLPDIEFRMPSKILVTGGAGYIGAHVCKALSESGCTPVVYDNLCRGHEESVKWGPLEIGDITDDDRLLEVIKRHKPEGVMHFAALAYVGESVENPGEYYRTNVRGMISLLSAMEKSSVKPIVYSSSCAIYGNAQTLPISEGHSQMPINPYGATKVMCERILKDFAIGDKLKWMALRYFNVAGDDPEGEIGENHDPETHVLPNLILTALGKRETFELYGTDLPTRDGTAIRDYIHVTDIANAHVCALQHLLGGGESGAFNLGTGHGFTIRELILAVENVTGNKLPVTCMAGRPGDPPELVADPSLGQETLNWQPQFSDIETIVRTAVQWHAAAI